MANSSERRKSKRFKLDQIIKILLGKEEYLYATGINISEHGLLCETSEYVEPQTRLFLMIKLPVENSNEEISFEGIVVWSEKENSHNIAGIEISQIGEKAKSLLTKYLKINN